MLGNRRLVIDEWAEVYDLLRDFADEKFWQWTDVQFDPDARYIVGRLVLKSNWQIIHDLCEQYPGRIIFCNPAEGSETIKLQLRRLRIHDLVATGKLGLITSGDLESGFDYVRTDCYFSNICEYTENLTAASQSDLVYSSPKIYDFLLLNGRLRPHRRYLLQRLRDLDLLKQGLWTCLQSTVDMPWSSALDLSQMPAQETVKLLPPEYEIDRAIPNLDKILPDRDIKHFLFNDTWGDAIINPKCYIDSAFSIVTETIYDYPYTFFTEKIWKPMIMCHPWIAVANPGFYRDLRNKGFKTFGHLIDESFDSIIDPTQRLERIISVIKHVIDNGAQAFLSAAQDVCKYNQCHLREFNRDERRILPQNLARYING